MIGLLRSELLRAWSRRTLRLLLVGFVLATVAGVGIATSQSERPSAEEIQRSEARRDSEIRTCIAEDWSGGRLPPGIETLEEYCREVVGAYVGPPGVIRSDQIPDVLLGASWLIALLGAVLGGTFGGADWTAGTMTTLLTWEPRRLRVLLVRAAVSVAVILSATLLVQVVFAVLFRAGVAVSGSTFAETEGLLGEIAGTIVRNGATAVAFGLVALAVSTLTRSTVGGLGILSGYLIVVEGFIANLIPELQKWLLLRGVIVFLTQEPLTIWDSSGSELFTIGLGQAGFVMVGWVTAVTALALVSFRMRDVT